MPTIPKPRTHVLFDSSRPLMPLGAVSETYGRGFTHGRRRRRAGKAVSKPRVRTGKHGDASRSARWSLAVAVWDSKSRWGEHRDHFVCLWFQRAAATIRGRHDRR